MKNPPYTPKTLSRIHTICLSSVVNRIISPIKIDSMKNADRPFIGIMVASIAILYTVIAILS